MGHLRRSARKRRLDRAAGLLVAAAALLVAGIAHGQVRPYLLVEGSRFQRGCFAPCLCPIGDRPLVGTFSLLPVSDNGLFAEYEMFDVHWKIQGSVPMTTPDAVIVGAGSYVIGGEVAIQQRMQADLQVDDEPPAAFDSGLVSGGSEFPAKIDVEISKNGKVCFDTAIRVVAEAQPIPEPGGSSQLLAGVVGLLATAAWRSRRPGCALGNPS